MKSARHQAILKLIEQYSIDRQEELLRHLRSIGFDVKIIFLTFFKGFINKNAY